MKLTNPGMPAAYFVLSIIANALKNQKGFSQGVFLLPSHGDVITIFGSAFDDACLVGRVRSEIASAKMYPPRIVFGSADMRKCEIAKRTCSLSKKSEIHERLFFAG
jgi:hypothetical protein